MHDIIEMYEGGLNILKLLFKAIDNSDIEKVKQIISEDPTLVSCVADMPQEIEGQSPLQVSIIKSECEIANYLIDQGADVNFIGAGALDEWKIPVLHVAIKAAIKNSRFPRRAADGPKNDGTLFNKHLDILKRLLDKGADINQVDSYGNLPIMRAVLDALNLDLSITDDELDEDIRSVFHLLQDYGADIQERTDNRKSVEEMFRNNVVIDYFK